MATIDWNALKAQAASEGYVSEILVGTYRVQIASTKIGKTQKGDPSIGVRLQVIEGPDQNKSVWDNLNLTLQAPKGLGLFFRKLGEYGVPESIFATGGDLTIVAGAFPVGATGTVVLSTHKWKEKDQQDVDSFTLDGVAGVVGIPVPQASQTVPQTPVQQFPVQVPGAPTAPGF